MRGEGGGGINCNFVKITVIILSDVQLPFFVNIDDVQLVENQKYILNKEDRGNVLYILHENGDTVPIARIANDPFLIEEEQEQGYSIVIVYCIQCT